METNNNAINSFILEIAVKKPISEICLKLQKKQFRDVDIKWLDAKLENFLKLAAKTLFVEDAIMNPDSIRPKYMNEYGYQYYSKYFGLLAEYFDSF